MGKDALMTISGPLLWVRIDQPKLTPAIKQEWCNKYDVQCRGGVELSLKLPNNALSARMRTGGDPQKIVSAKGLRVQATTTFHPAPTKDRSPESDKVYKASKYTDNVDLQIDLTAVKATLPGDVMTHLLQSFKNVFGATKHRYTSKEEYLAKGGVNLNAQRTAAWLKHCIKLGKWHPMHLYIALNVKCLDLEIPVNMYRKSTD